ncbi:hypothetical protein DVH24_033803 [Malus domestica]|uniref:Origin recognition complex subunit 6-like n=1 Tax=Malus domestica TaxID=3750 RepID=A0A498HRK9_MALDO|nr:hypothetical protein DVH24_033803 [Malus domestica]
MADAENQNPPSNPQPHLNETLTILLALATILIVIAVGQFDFVKPPSANAVGCDCKLNDCPCLPPFYIYSIISTAALSVVWFGLFILTVRFQYRFIIWVGLGLVWAIYWLAMICSLAPQFYKPMLYSFNPVLAVLLLLNIRFRNVLDRAMHVISDKRDHAIHVIANICILFWNYVTGNF